jgi:hypothetical protein
VTARLTLLALATAAAATAPALAAPTAHAAPLRSLGGKLEIRHTDDFKHGRSATSYQLLRRGRRIPLALTHAPQVRSGTSVVVTGRRAASRLKGTLRPLDRMRAKAAAYLARPHKTAVILVKFSPTASEPWTPGYVRQRVFTDPDSANAYYKEDSYGDISLVGKNRTDGDVYGWYAIPAPVPGDYGCDPDTIASDAEAAATAANGFDPAGYDHVIYAFPYQSLCGWAGLGEVGGSHAWINGYVDQVDVVAHELGHNMGLAHAASMSCTDAGTPVAIGPSCTTDEYGDPFDVMGDISAHRNNAWHLSQIGFMPPDNVQTANGEGTYTLSATSGRGGIRLLRIKRPAGSFPPYYDLELRAAGGVFDNFVSTDPAVQGIMIHTDPDTPVVDWSRLIDATPGSAGGFDDAALPVGRTFSDGTVTITLQSVTAGVATVDVTTGAPPQDLTPPTVPGPVTVAASPTSVALSWAASSDDFGVAGYRVYRGSTQLTTTGALTWADAVVTPGSVYTYRVSAFDAAGHTTSSAPVTVTVPQPPPTDSGGGSDPTSTDPTGTTPQPGGATSAGRDLKRPRVSIKSPSRRSRVRGRATVRAVATDNVRVARMEVWVDLKRRKSVRGGKLSWRWVVRHARPGRHVIAVRAFDAAGNESTATVRPFVVR